MNYQKINWEDIFTPEEIKQTQMSVLMNQIVRSHPHFKDNFIHVSWNESFLGKLVNATTGDERLELANSAIANLIAMEESVARGEYKNSRIDENLIPIDPEVQRVINEARI